MHVAQVHQQVKHYYETILKSSEDLKTNACCAGGAPPQHLRPLLERIHPQVLARSYGCGYPIPDALKECSVLDLGCGTGRDAYLISQLAGPKGAVYGVDMSSEQLSCARDAMDWHYQQNQDHSAPVQFFEGYLETLEQLPIDAQSLDVIVSNCVINLSPMKERVLEGAYALLKPGGELYFCDVLADRRLPDALRQDPVLYGECLGGAAYLHDFVDTAKRVGFADPRVVKSGVMAINDATIAKQLGEARFFSITYRFFKIPSLETHREDYGQTATLKKHTPLGECFKLDESNLFQAEHATRVCGNTALMLEQTRYAPYFHVEGNRDTHLGAFVERPSTDNSAATASTSCC